MRAARLFGVSGRLGARALWSAVLIALSAIFIEALWRCRPWVVRVAAAWTAMHVVSVLINVADGRPERLLEPSVRAAALLPLVVYGVVMAYVYDRSRRLGAPGRRPVPQPVP